MNILWKYLDNAQVKYLKSSSIIADQEGSMEICLEFIGVIIGFHSKGEREKEKDWCK